MLVVSYKVLAKSHGGVLSVDKLFYDFLILIFSFFFASIENKIYSKI